MYDMNSFQKIFIILDLDGLRGPLIIRANPEVYAKEYDDEMIVQLTDWYHEQSNVLIDRYLHVSLFVQI